METGTINAVAIRPRMNPRAIVPIDNCTPVLIEGFTLRGHQQLQIDFGFMTLFDYA